MSLHLIFRLCVFAIIGGVATYVWAMVLRGQILRTIPFVILTWAVSGSYVKLPSLVYYTDPHGVVNKFGVSSLLLVIVFVGLAARQGAFVGRFLQTPIFVAFYVLLASAVITQAWYLGFVPGVGVAYARVVQPMMVVILLAYLGRDEAGLRRAFVWIVGAVALAIALRYAAGAALNPGVVSTDVLNAGAAGQRVSGLGSWTIYGTICASVVPLVASLLVIDRNKWERAALIVFSLVALKEVLATGTRGAVLGLAALLVFMLRRKARWWVAALVGTALLAAVAFGFEAGFSGSRPLSFNVHTMLDEPTTQVRFDRNMAAVIYIARHPMTGSGLGIPLRVNGTDIGTWVYNPYLAWGVAMGVVALLSFVAIVAMTVLYSVGNWRASSGTFRTLQVGLTAALIVWLINQFTTGDSLTYLQAPEATFFFYAIVGLTVGSHMARRMPVFRVRPGLA